MEMKSLIWHVEDGVHKYVPNLTIFVNDFVQTSKQYQKEIRVLEMLDFFLSLYYFITFTEN